MEVALISDIHSNLPALECVLDEVSGFDNIFCAGDVVGYNPFPSEVISLLEERDVSCVLGNHDYAFLNEDTEWFNPEASRAIHWTIENTSERDREYIDSLPKFLEKEVRGVSFYLTHGSISSINEYVYPTAHPIKLRGMLEECGADVLVLGHTHVSMVEEFDEGTVVNPGSVGQPRDGDERASYLVVDLDEMDFELNRVPYDIDRVNEKIQKTNLPDRLGERLYYGK